MLNFFGWWNPPSGRYSNDSSGAESDYPATSEAITAFAFEGGAPAPAPAKGSRRLLEEAPADDGSDAKASVQNVGWCPTENWYVEQMAAGKVLWPPDLHSAQVQARRDGVLK